MARSVRPAALVLLVLAAAGCSSAQPWEGTQLDEAGWSACQSFGEAIRGAGGAAAFYALPAAQRAPAVDDVVPDLSRSSWTLAQDTAAVLQRTRDAGGPAWTLAADTVAGRCLDAGWTSS